MIKKIARVDFNNNSNLESYLYSIEINDMPVNFYTDDYGQQYYFEFLKNGKVIEVGCGAYNLYPIQVALDYFGVTYNLEEVKNLVEELEVA